MSFPIIEDPAVVEERVRRRWAKLEKDSKPKSEQLPTPSPDIPIVLAYTPPKCPECGGRLDLKPVLCIGRAHLMRYENRKEDARIRQAKHRSK